MDGLWAGGGGVIKLGKEGIIFLAQNSDWTSTSSQCPSASLLQCFEELLASCSWQQARRAELCIPRGCKCSVFSGSRTPYGGEPLARDRFEDRKQQVGNRPSIPSCHLRLPCSELLPFKEIFRQTRGRAAVTLESGSLVCNADVRIKQALLLETRKKMQAGIKFYRLFPSFQV